MRLNGNKDKQRHPAFFSVWLPFSFALELLAVTVVKKPEKRFEVLIWKLKLTLNKQIQATRFE